MARGLALCISEIVYSLFCLIYYILFASQFFTMSIAMPFVYSLTAQKFVCVSANIFIV